MPTARKRFLLRCAAPFLVALVVVAAWLPTFLRQSRKLARVTSGTPRSDLAPGPVTPRLEINFGYGAFLDPTGQLWIWGYEPGLNPVSMPSDREVPRAVTKGTHWLTFAGSGNHLLLIRDDHTLWGSGHNFWGQLGASTPTASGLFQISSDTNWASVAAGSLFSAALRHDGSLWALGGNPSFRPAPARFNAANPSTNGLTAVAPTHRWLALAASGTLLFAIHTNRTLWFHVNDSGSWRTEPLDTNALWSAVAADPNAQGSALALRSDGALFMIPQDQLGIPTAPALRRAFRPVPGSEGTSWRRILSARGGMVAQRADGSWWGLGQRLPFLDASEDRPNSTQLTPLVWPDNTPLVATTFYSTAAILPDGTLWYTGNPVGKYSQQGSGPAHTVASLLRDIGFGIGFPGARHVWDRGSVQPARLWTWPGSGTNTATP